MHPGQRIFIESTADGREGDFHEFCMNARNRAAEGVALTALDFRFHFFAWWRHPGYVLAPDGLVVPEKLTRYFAALTAVGIRLSAAQKA